MTDEFHNGMKKFKGKQRQYLLFRVAGYDKQQSMFTTDTTQNEYTIWCHNKQFVEFHRKVDDFYIDYRKDAIKLLRRDNQLNAVLLEAKIVSTLKDEIESGLYVLAKTQLAKEVYNRLLDEVDKQPKTQNTTWIDNINAILGTGVNQNKLEAGNEQVTEETINGEFESVEGEEETAEAE